MEEFYRYIQKYFLSSLVAIMLLVGSFVYAQLQSSPVRIVETVHIFPGAIESNGWSNVETLLNQNLDGDALYQDFNTLNSAYLKEKAKVRPVSTVRLEGSTDAPTSATSTATTTDAVATTTRGVSDDTATSSATTTTSAIDPVPTPESGTTTSATTTEETVQVAPTPEPAPTATTTESTDTATETTGTSSATTTVLQRLENSFTLAFATLRETFTFANESSTTTTGTVAEDTTDEEVTTENSTEEEVVEPIASTTTEGAPEVATTTPPAPTDEVVATSSVASTTPAETPTTTIDMTEDPVTTTGSESAETETVETASDNTEAFAITLRNFWLPVFGDEDVTLDGGQLRVSMAAQKRSQRIDALGAVAVEYSLDSGATWQAGGVVEVEDEMSNSINGGYYLFALPLTGNPAQLEGLSVRLVYQGDHTDLENIFIDSAWLEVFTARTEDTAVDPLEAFEDNFQSEPLSGDRLELPNGEEINFTFTDDNDGESLIIKSDGETYNGLSRTTTYFSVTNTSNRADTVSVKTYFPDNVGEVTSLRLFEQNQPRTVRIPEYRPYVYHCAAGWETVAAELAPVVATTDTAASTTPQTGSTTEAIIVPDVAATSTDATAATAVQYSCAATAVAQACDTIDGDGTQCMVTGVQVAEHQKTQYVPGWDMQAVTTEVTETQNNRLTRLGGLLGISPATKDIPSAFEPRTETINEVTILPGETKYFEMEIEFPPFSRGEYWIEAIGTREYGLLDPFWNSSWTYRLPIEIDNTDGTTDLTEHQVFMQLDSALSDFWSNVQSDGSDIRFVQETQMGNLFQASSSAFENPYDPAWSSRLSVTIPASQVTAAVDDFPVFVDLSDLGDVFWSNVRSDGGDIRITRSDGRTEVPLSVVEINTNTRTGELHFLADRLSSVSDTTFHVYIGNPSATTRAVTDPLGRNAVWADFEAVYHFSDNATTTGDTYTDQTGNGRDLTITDDNVATTTGAMGTALDLTVTGTGYLTNTTWNWVTGEDLVSSGLYQQGANSAEAMWQWGTANTPNWMSYMPWYNNGTATGRGYLYHGRNANAIWDRTAIVNQWTHFTTVSETTIGGRHVIYENAVEELTNTQSVTDPSNTGDLQVGRYTTAGSYNGFIDELRFTTNDTARTDGWVAAEDTNHRTPSTFYATSTTILPTGEVSDGWFSTSWNNRQKITLPPSADITDFPVYVDLSILGSEFFTNVASDGSDIRVVSADGFTEYPIEVVSVNTASSTGELYFKTDLTSADYTDYYIYYNNDDAVAYARDDTYGSENVWSNGFIAVYHLEEDAAGTGNNNLYQDSTANEYHGDDFNTSDDKTGLFGRGQEFGDDQTDYISLPNEVLDGQTDITTSWWHNTSVVSDMTIVSGANSGQANEYWTRWDSNTVFRLYAQGGQEPFTLDNGATFNDGTWQYYLVTSDDDIDEMNFYRNGVGDTENPDPQAIATTTIDNGGLIIGQDQDVVGGNFSTAENFEGLLDSLRFASVVRDADWAETVYANMSDNEAWIATSSAETLSTTVFTELDFWVQHFDYTGQEADVWVQVESLPAGAKTIIWLYYGASGVTSASDESATFSYSSPRDLYYVVDDSGADDISVVSLIDDNQVSVDGAGTVTLDTGERTVFSTFTGASVISANGPISATVTHTANDNSDALVPISFATTTYTIPTSRDTNRWYVYAPFATSTVDVYIEGGTATQTQTINTGTVATFTVDPADSGAANDGEGVLIESDQPVLAFHRTTSPGDGIPLYPPTLEDLYGYDSNYAYVGALGSTNVDFYCSNGSTNGTESGLTKGDRRVFDTCAGATQMSGDALRLTGHTEEIAAQQQADSDGREATIFLPEREFAANYAMTNDTQYMAVVCSPRFGTSTIDVINTLGQVIETQTCNAGGDYPGTVYFGSTADVVSYTAGHRLQSSDGVPFYVAYEDLSVDTDGDEKNVFGPVQARQYDTSFNFIFGEQELANDALYEQRSFLWYENGDSYTPTSTWPIDTENVVEGEAIRGAGSVDVGDLLRLRMNIAGSNATGTLGSAAYKLQYAAGTAGQCSAVSTWTDVGAIGSTVEAFVGYNNTALADGTILSTSTLVDTTVLGTYEERNLSNVLQNEIGIGDVMEFDWVLRAETIAVNTNYCFRMVRAAGQPLATYTIYPELETVGPPNVPTPLTYFDNAHIADLDTRLTFVTVDNTGDDIDYQVQIDTDPTFPSPVVDVDSADSFLDFENTTDPADKAPFASGDPIAFITPTTLSSSTTYWWRVRASDPDGSATSSDWSTARSFTTNTGLATTEWYQTTGDQFATNEITGLTVGTSSVSGATGTVVATSVDFDDALIGNAWGEVFWSDAESAGTITVQVEFNNNGTWELIPDTVLAGNSVGTSTSPINILALDTDTYNELRLVANFGGTALLLEEWGIRWALRVETPVQGDLFDNQKTAATLPVFDFISSDPQGDDLEYEISFDTDRTFTSSTTYNSSTSAQFANPADGGDTSPFNSGEEIRFTTPGGTPFTNGTTYWWRTRAKDPAGGDAWSPWSEADSFTVDTLITESTWFQTTQQQFEQGVLDGTIASTSDAVELTDEIGEYGTATLTNSNWTTVNTNLSYDNMVVVASAEYSVSGQADGRTPRVRNKGTNSFEIKVDDHNGYTGSTIVDYIVMEAGEWTMDDGGTGITIYAGTESGVTEVISDNYNTTNNGRTVTVGTSFGSNPLAFATVVTNNDSSWVSAHLDDSAANTEWNGGNIRLALAKSMSRLSHTSGEDIDYILMDQGAGDNSGVRFQTQYVFNDVQDSFTNPGHNFTGLSGFSAAPPVTVMYQNAEGGGNGSFALKDLSGTQSATNLFASVIEVGVDADAHGGNETVSVIAFDASSGVITRLDSGALSGSFAGEPIIFSDGAGPKFGNFDWTDNTPGSSDIIYQLQYEVSEDVWALIPDSEIPGNSVGTTTGPIDLTNVDINLYPTIRGYATLSCGGGSCPQLQDWQLEWSAGVNMTGTLREYDRTTNVATGTIRAAVNGVLLGGTGTVSAGVWTLNNVTAFAGDTITVWVDDAQEADEAVTIFTYDGVGDITGVNLYEQHVSIDADELGTVTNAGMALYDNSVSGDEDIFFDVDGAGNLTVCAVGTCPDANIYIAPNQEYRPSSTTATIVTTHDIVNDGTLTLDTNTLEVTGSWQNTATTSVANATVAFTALSGTETIIDPSDPLAFNTLSFGTSTSVAQWDIAAALDLSGDLSVLAGTFNRGTSSINVAGNVSTAAGAVWSGVGTTTFDGTGTATWQDLNATTSLQSIGLVIVDGSSKTVVVDTAAAAYDITIGANDTLNGGSNTYIEVGGDWTNTGTFIHGTSEVVIVPDERVYPDTIPGSSDWYSDTDFVNRLPIALDSGEIASELSNFPVYVDLSTMGSMFWDTVRSDGGDIRVTTADGQTEVAVDLVWINSDLKTGELHFLAPTASSTADTTFYIYFNNPTATAPAAFSTYGSEAVWVDYDAVYHFEVDDTSLSATVPDVSGNGNDLTIVDAALATTTGQLGTALDLSGSTGILTAGLSLAAGTRSESSGWYQMGAASNEALWSWGTGSDMNFMPWFSGTQRGYHRFGSTAGTYTFDFTPRDTVNWQHFSTVGPTSTSEQVITYINTIVRDNPLQNTADPAGGSLQIGRYQTTGSWEGSVDELRFTQRVRGSDWVDTEFANQSDAASFVATSSIETYVPDIVPDEATHQISTGGSSFYALTLNDATTTPYFTDSVVTVDDDFKVATGTVTFPTSKLTVGGSFINKGFFAHNNAELDMTSNSSEIIALGGTAFLNTLEDLTFDGTGSWSFVDTHATTTGTVDINSGTVTFPSGNLYIGNTLDVTGTGSFDANGGTVLFGSTGEAQIRTNNSDFNNVQFGTLASLPWFGGDWSDRIPVTIAPSVVGEDLTNFPVYIDLSDLGANFWSDVASDGADIRVTNGTGFTQLPASVVSINTATQSGEMHFRADTINRNATTTFYIYYNNPGAEALASEAPFGSESVWSEYEAVYHFADDPALGVPDETGNGRTLSTTVGTAATTTGILGNALDTTSGSVRLEAASWTWPAGQDLTSSGWYFQSADDTGALWQFGVASGGVGEQTYLHYLPWYDSVDRGYFRFGETSGSDFRFTRDNTIWHHFFTNGSAASGGTNEIYEDNILRDSVVQNTTGQNPTNGGLRVGAYQTTTYMDIQIDELRFGSTTRSSSWVAAEHDNGRDPAAFYGVETSESFNDAVPHFTLNEAFSEAVGNVVIQSAELIAPSNTFTIGGSFTTTQGLYDPNTATTLFNSGAGAETISIEDNSFYNLTFNAPGGDWTPSGNIDVINNADLADGTQFTLAPNAVMTVGGIFTNSFASAATTWTDSTLVLTGGDYEITGRLDAGDDYATLQVSDDSDIVLWNSTIATSSIFDTSSIYMPDFGGTDGLLRIFGDYDRMSGTEHWSYATDFDGTDLTGGSERTVTVEIGNGSSLQFGTSTTLSVLGDTTATTTVDVIFGLYGLVLNNATFDVQYAAFAGMGADGIELRDGTILNTFSSVDVAVPASRTGITVDAATMSAQPSSAFTGISFASSTATTLYDPAWSSQLILTVPASSTNDTLTDYPVYVNLASLGADFWSNVQSDGADIRVTTAGADELPIEVVSINTSTQTGEMHFLAPAISSSEDTDFFIHYNNPGATAYASDDRYGVEAVWDNYEAVYHFENDPSGTIPNRTAIEGRDLLPAVGTAATTSAVLGTAVDTTSSNVRLDAAGWTWTSGEDLISSGIYRQAAVDTGGLWQFGAGNGSNNGTYLAFLPDYDGSGGRHFFGITTGGAYDFTRDYSSWHHFTTIGRAASGEVNEIYEDTILRDTVTQIGTSENPSNTGLSIGTYQNTIYMEIQVDELRFATSTQGTSWINAEYLNFTDPEGFYATSTLSMADGTNITTDGAPTTFWLFSAGQGDRYGESYDADDGDPGSIQWDDSNYNISISGVVYADDGVTPMGAPVCNNSTQVVTIVVDGTDTYHSACDAATGAYEITGVTYVGEPKITAYLDSNASSSMVEVALLDEITGTGVMTGTNMTVNRPEVIDNSVLVLIAGKDDNPNFNTLAGWTAIDILGNSSGDDIANGAWYKVVPDASIEPASYTFTAGDGGEAYSYWMGSLINVNTASPLATSTGWSYLLNEYDPTAPAATTTVDGSLVLAASYNFNDSDIAVPGGTWAIRAQNVADGTNNNNLNVVSKTVTPPGGAGSAQFYNLTVGRESQVIQFAIAPDTTPTATSSATAATVTKTPLGSTGAAFRTITLVDQRTAVGDVLALSSFDVERPDVENGDVLIAVIAKEDEFTLDTPAGWTLAASRAETNGNDMYTAVLYRVIQDAASEADSYTFVSNDTTSEEFSAWIGAYRGVDSTNIFDVDPVWSNLQNTSSPAAPSITTSADGAMVLAAWYVIDDATMVLPGAPWDDVLENAQDGNRNLSLAAQIFNTAGVTGAATLTGGSTDDVNVVQFALTPEPVSVADSITDFDLYQNRLIVRHEDITPLTIADLNVFDSGDDADIPYLAATSTTPDSLTVAAGAGLVVWDNKTFSSTGDVTLAGVGATTTDGSLRLNTGSTFVMDSTDDLTIGGSFYMDTGATFTAPSTTVTFTATNDGQSIAAAGSSTVSFIDLNFTGVGGGWAVQTPIFIANNMAVTNGTVRGVSDIVVDTGSLSGNGTIAMTGGTTRINQTNTFGGTTPWQFYNLQLGDGVTGGAVTTPAGTATTTVLNTFTIAAGHLLDANNSVWNLTGDGTAFNEIGTFLEDTSTIIYGGNAAITRTPYYNLTIDAANGASTAVAPNTGLQIFGDLAVGTNATTTLDFNTNDPLVAVTGNVFIGAFGTTSASDVASFQIFGDYDNDGTFIANDGLVEMLQATGTASIAAGNSAFADLTIGGGAVFTMTESATATDDFILSGPFGFTLQSGETLAVGGTFTNIIAGGSSNWTGTTLHLYGGQSYTVNTSVFDDSYATVLVSSSTHPRFWNSSFGSLTTTGSSSVYSMDHADTAGDLYIFGDYLNTSFTDEWSYLNDWDGTVLGAPRQANVYIEGGGSATYSGGSLTAVGTSTATTTIQNQGAGNYILAVGGSAALDWQSIAPRDITGAGLQLTGAPTVTDFREVDWLVDANNASAMTVDGTVINANPAKNFDRNSFNETGVTAPVNVTTTGSSVSSWRFTNHDGNLDGESFDNDSGDPGEIVWADSAALITVTGTVYSDEGSTAMGIGVCDGLTNNVKLVVAGLTLASTSCAIGTGVYTFTNVGFGPADPIIVYIGDGATAGATVTVDPISNINNMDIYQDRVIVRHESTDPVRIADLAQWDSSDDADIPFTAIDAVTDTLTLPTDTKLIVWDNKEFAPAGDVTLSTGTAAHAGTVELYSGATFTGNSGESHTVGGELLTAGGASLALNDAAVTFSSTQSGQTIDSNLATFGDVTWSGSGDWSVSDATFTATGDIAITAGDVTFPSATSTLGGDFVNSGGSFDANNGVLEFTATDPGNTVTFGGSDVHDAIFVGGGTWSVSDTNATSSGTFTVATGTVTLPSGTLAVAEDFVVIDTVAHNNGTVILTSSNPQSITLSGNDLSSLTISGSGDFSMTDDMVALLGDLIILSGTLDLASTTTSIGGSLDAVAGVFTAGTSTVLFNSADAGETVMPGSNEFYNLVFAGSGTSGWTLSSATTTNNFSLTTANTFTLGSSETLRVDGVFTNLVGGAATTWTGSEIILAADTDYSVNTKSAGGDDYNLVTLLNDTDVRFWDSSYATPSLSASSSIYSQDHAGVSGALEIYGTFTIAGTAEYWSYATDFDGVALGGGSRVVNVTLATSTASAIVMESGSLNIIGTTGASTTIASADSTLYSMSVSGGTFNADFYTFDDLDEAGLTFVGTPTITSLNRGTFNQATNTATLITLPLTALDANASLMIDGSEFNNNGFTGGANVTLDATSTNSWIFTNHTGNLSGEAYDVDGEDACSSLRWDDSACLLTEQTEYRWRNDDGGEGALDSTWYDTNWNARERIRLENTDGSTYSNVPVLLELTYDVDMQTDFDDLRFTSGDGTTLIDHWMERFTTGVSADVWVEVPTLTAASTTEIFMYYDNATATSVSSTTAVFIAVDDFESGSLANYSGDTSLFNIGSSLVWGGANSLDTAGNETARATDGIFDLNQTVGQGEIIRYRQYVDASGSDESCTLFGVQSPGTTNANYGVCIELQGTDRLSLVRDAESTDLVGGVTVLDTTNVTYSTGWYEIEIDWQTDDTIDVSLFDSGGSLVASTTATDTNYSSGSFGFTFWGFNGAWDSIVSYPRLDTKPNIFFGAKQTDGGATWRAEQGVPGSGYAVSDVARLRIAVENSGLPVTDEEFKLEYASKGTAPSCEAVMSASFAMVPAAGSCGSDPVCMTTSVNVTSGDATTDHLTIPTGTFTPGEIVANTDNMTDMIDIGQGNFTELEYVLNLTVNATDDAYCFRVTNDGTPLDSYSSVAELTLEFAPSLGAVTLNEGSDIVLTPGTTTQVFATTTVTDLNGFADLVAATTTFYRTAVTASCTPDDNNCYQTSTGAGTCSFTGCSGNSCELSCAAPFAYHTDPTDAGSPNAGEEWFAFVEVADAADNTDFDTSVGTIDVLTMRALDVTDGIAYGTLDINGETVNGTNPTSTLTNLGNEAIDVDVSGTDLTDGAASVIDVALQKFATSTFAYTGCAVCTTLSEIAGTVEVDLDKPTTVSPPVVDYLYWGITIPLGTNSVPHTGLNTFMATGD